MENVLQDSRVKKFSLRKFKFKSNNYSKIYGTSNLTKITTIFTIHSSCDNAKFNRHRNKI